MSTGRRSPFATALLGLCAILAGADRTPAQERQQNELWNSNVPPEQIREAFLQLHRLPADINPLAQDIINKVLGEHPDIPREKIERAVQEVLKNPEAMKAAREIARKYQGKIDPGKIKPEDRHKLRAAFEKANKNKQIPAFPKDLGTSPGPGTTPGQEPGPGGPPPFRSGTNPNVDPNPQTPPQPQGEPPPPGKLDPRPPQPSGPDRKGSNEPAQPQAPNTPPEPTPPAPAPDPDPFENTDAARNQRAREAVTKLVEQNIGPLNDNPELKAAIDELLSGADDLRDSEGNSLLDALGKDGGDGAGLADWLKNAGLGDGRTDFGLDFGSLDFGGGGGGSGGSGGGGGSSRGGGFFSGWGGGGRSRSGGSIGSGSSGGSLDGIGVPLAFLLIILIGALILWKVMGKRQPQPEMIHDLDGLGRWPVDPRRIASREELVQAFEYLSVMICGPSAKAWTHTTIAAALTDLATTHTAAAAVLARLYELARYTPLDEPLGEEQLDEARRLVCGLAGVRYP